MSAFTVWVFPQRSKPGLSYFSVISHNKTWMTNKNPDIISKARHMTVFLCCTSCSDSLAQQHFYQDAGSFLNAASLHLQVSIRFLDVSFWNERRGFISSFFITYFSIPFPPVIYSSGGWKNSAKEQAPCAYFIKICRLAANYCSHSYQPYKRFKGLRAAFGGGPGR